MKKLIMLCISVNFFFQLGAQNTITGKVSDDKNAPLPGVSIQVKNTTRGTFTGTEGEYSITASPADTLLFSMISMATQEIPVGSRTRIDVKMLIKVAMLGEAVVVGYGTQERKDLTAPIVTVTGEDLNKQVASNPIQALQGKINCILILYGCYTV